MMSAETTASDSARFEIADAGALHAPFLEALPVDGGSISVGTDAGNHSAISSSDDIAARLEQLQYELGEGPHWDSIHEGRTILIPDVQTVDHGRWPLFGDAVSDLDVGALFCFPLIMGAATIGVVDLYRTRPGALSPLDVARGSSLAAAAAGPAVRRAISSAGDDGQDGADAVPEMRREVHQATGMITVQLDVGATEAFARLRGFAFSSGRSIQTIAHDVVSRKVDFRDAQG